MHAVVTGVAATLPLVIVTLAVFGIVSKQAHIRLINWIATIPTFCVTIIVANIYASQHGGGGMWVWYVIVIFLTVFVALPCAASDDNTSHTSNN